jgi:hypothetical protein
MYTIGWKTSKNSVSDPYRIHLIWIRIHHFRLNTDPDPIRIQGSDDQKLEKFTTKKIKFFGSKTTIYLSLGPQKIVQAREEAFSPQKRISRTSKHELFFSTYVDHFGHPDPDSESGFRIRVRIRGIH